MKLSKLYEYLDVADDSHKFYGDPKGKAEPLTKGNSNLSPLIGNSKDRDGHKDRNKFLDTMQGQKKRKKKK